MVSNLVGNRLAELRRQWRWEQIEAFRVEPAVGSHFLRAQIDGQWIDVLRRPGDVSRELTDLVGRLNARRGRIRELRGGAENGRDKSQVTDGYAVTVPKRKIPHRCE